ncbi:MAG: sodium:solute symporter family protein [Leadbetterella sp.]|nr:sodium:solute symporter family protein [Leadbetterella sp.]
MLLLFVIVYLLATLAVGGYASRFVKTAGDFAVAGRKLPAFVVTSGLFATWFGSETVMGASSEFIEKGVLGVIEDPFGAALCLLLIGLFYARPMYKLKLLTFSDYFRVRFGKAAEWVSAVFMIPSYFSWIAAQLVALALLLQVLADVPFFWGITVCTAVVVFYTYIGGMWSVSITDTIQTVIIIVGMVILTMVMLNRAGGFTAITAQVPDDFWRITPKENSFQSWAVYLAAWMTIGLGSIPQQDVFQRVMAARSARTAVISSLLASGMYFSVACMPLLIGLCGSLLYPSLLNGDTQMAIPLLVLQHMGTGMQILTFGALLSAILSTCSGAVLAPATVLAENLIKPLYSHKMSDKTLLRIMRYSVIVIALISMGLALHKKHIFELVAESSALSLVALFVPLTAGLYWKRASLAGALLSMITGTAAWSYFEFFPNDYPSLLWGLAASICGMVAGSLFFRRDTTGAQ